MANCTDNDSRGKRTHSALLPCSPYQKLTKLLAPTLAPAILHMQTMKSTISDKCQPRRCSGFTAWCLKAMRQHVMSTGICTGFSNKIKTSSSSTLVPAGWRSCYLQLAPSPSISLVWAPLPASPSYEYVLTHSALHELEETRNDCLTELFQPTFGQVGQKRLLATLARWDYWPRWPKRIFIKALHSSCWSTPAAYSKSLARIVVFALPLKSFSSRNSHLHLASYH